MKIPDTLPMRCADCSQLVGYFVFARLDKMTQSAFRLMSGGALGDMLGNVAAPADGSPQTAEGGLPIVCNNCVALANKVTNARDVQLSLMGDNGDGA